jgi:hypothetical protein
VVISGPGTVDVAAAHPSAKASDSAARPAAGSIPAARPLAPDGPPLTRESESSPRVGAESGAEPEAQADPLVSNGLRSPLCEGVLGPAALTAQTRSHCEASGFAAAPAPTTGYAIDVHIDTGVLGISTGGLLSVVQDLFVAPVWMALLWSVHAMVSLLEWAFAIDLLDSPPAGGLGPSLRRMQSGLTQPWLASVLAVAGLLAAYKGLVRRRLTDAAGELLAMVLMMVGGMWVIADPTGTVGALATAADRASIGTFAVGADGSAAGGGRALAGGLAEVFAQVIEAPWCYLEFGNVGWCRDPARLDARLRAAALAIAEREAPRGCRHLRQAGVCGAPGTGVPSARELRARGLREARTNGALFLALPANGPDRNSISEPGSLLHALCQSDEVSSCRGPTAAEAEFRADGGTWPRVAGLVLIVAGAVGMLLLLGSIVVRLLTAAILTLLLLLLSPGVVLCPALGERGRAVFRGWVLQLIAALLSKVIFAFLLGVVLAVGAILDGLSALGWWTQWLLSASFWWTAYLRRGAILSLPGGALVSHQRSQRAPLERLRASVEPPRRAVSALRGRWEHHRALAAAGAGDATGYGRGRRGPPSLAQEDPQAARLLESDLRHASARRSPGRGDRLGELQAQLLRLADARTRARDRGQLRPAHELAQRHARVQRELAREQRAQDDAAKTMRAGERASQPHGRAWRQELIQERAEFLDAQAAAPCVLRATRERSKRRDYGRLSALLGYSRSEYHALDPAQRRAVRLELDRELARRPPAAGQAGTGAAVRKSSAPNVQSPAGGVPDPRDSPVMRDAMEVVARRKRQLGYGRP